MKSSVITFARTLKLFGGMLACSILVTTATAHIAGTVFCDTNGNGVLDQGEPGIPGVKVSVCDLSKVTDANGNYFFSAAELNAAICVPPVSGQNPWIVSVDSSTVPGDCNRPGCPTSVMVFVTPADNVNFCFRPPPPCPDCVDPALGLGAAAGCTVLQLGAAKVSITGPAGGIFGDVCVAPGGKLDITGDEYITGVVHLGTGATFSNSSGSTVNVLYNVDLSPEISAAYAAAANAASLPCTQSFVKLDGKTITTINGGVGLNVICVQDIVLSGTQIYLNGPAGAKFVFNITGKLVFTGGGAGPQIRVTGGVQSKDVLYNLIGIGADVAFSGGGGGVNCCAAIIDETILAPSRKINLSPGRVNGQIISGKDISIVSGSSVRCPPCTN
jgi:choice-of-anchor A domain-containing protein